MFIFSPRHVHKGSYFSAAGSGQFGNPDNSM